MISGTARFLLHHLASLTAVLHLVIYLPSVVRLPCSSIALSPLLRNGVHNPLLVAKLVAHHKRINQPGGIVS
ncbi:hypothetical protein GGR55DRAFT_647237, partial [Xylaria sp. FL0064]